MVIWKESFCTTCKYKIFIRGANDVKEESQSLDIKDVTIVNNEFDILDIIVLFYDVFEENVQFDILLMTYIYNVSEINIYILLFHDNIFNIFFTILSGLLFFFHFHVNHYFKENYIKYCHFIDEIYKFI
jgi:hypothetical protein